MPAGTLPFSHCLLHHAGEWGRFAGHFVVMHPLPAPRPIPLPRATARVRPYYTAMFRDLRNVGAGLAPALYPFAPALHPVPLPRATTRDRPYYTATFRDSCHVGTGFAPSWYLLAPVHPLSSTLSVLSHYPFAPSLVFLLSVPEQLADLLSIQVGQ